MPLVAYFDASGDAKQPALVVAGLLATPAQWVEFSGAWKAVLDAEGVSALHMRQFAHSRGQFKEWKADERRRARFIERLGSVITQHTLKSVSVTLYLDHYNDFNRVFRLRERLGGPYAFTSLFALNLATLWRDRHHPRETISYLFESGDNDQADLLKTLRRLKIANHFDVTFAPKKSTMNGMIEHHYPFQAADFVAYECGKASRTLFQEDVKQGKLVTEITARKSLLHVAPKARDLTWRFIDSGLLREFCRGKLGVRPRA